MLLRILETICTFIVSTIGSCIVVWFTYWLNHRSKDDDNHQ